MRVRYKPWAEDYLKDHPDLVDMDGSHAGHIDEWFDKKQPIYIEIGSGMGQFITTLAAQHPDINFVSMEREKSVMYKVLDKVKEQNLSNLKMICNDAIELNEYFKNGEVSRIYLNFSDPWPKKRHAKRRLTYHTYLALYK
ncbi:tRNA (guanosine(46)-N7)-methyltransferase TrmB, partial [Staphylococcus warneri]